MIENEIISFRNIIFGCVFFIYFLFNQPNCIFLWNRLFIQIYFLCEHFLTQGIFFLPQLIDREEFGLSWSGSEIEAAAVMKQHSMWVQNSSFKLIAYFFFMHFICRMILFATIFLLVDVLILNWFEPSTSTRFQASVFGHPIRWLMADGEHYIRREISPVLSHWSQHYQTSTPRCSAHSLNCWYILT